MGKVKEAVIAWPHNVQEELNEHRNSHFSFDRTNSNDDSVMTDLEKVLFSPIPFEGAGLTEQVEEYIEDLAYVTPALGLSNPLDLPTESKEPIQDSLLGSVFAPIHTNTPLHSIPSSHIPLHSYPPNPVSMVMPQQPNYFLNSPLSPLSCGGFIFNQGNTNLPPSTPFVTPFVPLRTGSDPFTQTVTPVSLEIASRQEKLDKFRQKRTKRNYNRTADTTRRERAVVRTRDEYGHFVVEATSDLKDVKIKLEKSQEESNVLKSKLLEMEREMALLKQRAEQATQSHEVIMRQLAAQENMNSTLLMENRLLWTSVPSHEVFCTVKQVNVKDSKTPSHYLNVKPFEQKIDLKLAANDLTNTDSRILEAARAEEVEYEKRWEALTFAPGGAC